MDSAGFCDKRGGCETTTPFAAAERGRRSDEPAPQCYGELLTSRSQGLKSRFTLSQPVPARFFVFNIRHLEVMELTASRPP